MISTEFLFYWDMINSLEGFFFLYVLEIRNSLKGGCAPQFESIFRTF